MQSDLRRLKPCRSASQVAADPNCSCGLQRHSATPRLSFELQLPAATRDLLDAAGNASEGERQLVILILEIDAAFIELNSFEAIHRWSRRGRTVNVRIVRVVRFRRRQPLLEVPMSLEIAHESKARLAEGQGSKFEMTAQQSRPARAGAQVFRAKEILIAEGGCFANRNSVSVQLQDGYETHAKTADLHRPSKGSLQVSDEIGMNPMSPHQKGGPYLQGHYRQGNGNRQLPPFSQCVHLASKSKGVSPKKVANQGKTQSDKPLMDGA